MSDQIGDQKLGRAPLNANASTSRNAGGGEIVPAIGANDQTDAKNERMPDVVERSAHRPPDTAGPKALYEKADDADKKASETDGDAGEGAKKADQKDERLLAKLRTHPLAVAVGVIVMIAGVSAGILWYLHSRHYASTDDAFIDGRPISINLQVTGNIVSVPVTDNQIVKVGELLIQIDDRDYRAAVELAQAQIEQAQANVDNFSAQIVAQESQIAQTATQVDQAQATRDFSKDQDTRYKDLAQTGAGSAQRAQQATSELRANNAALGSTQAAKMVAERQINVLNAQRKNALAQLAQAKAQKASADANLTRTQLHATADGRVTRLTAAVGQLANPAQGVMVLVPFDVWVTANFKETQLADIRIGQPVDIWIDAFGRHFPGHVDSVQSGSGTAFSLLPAQNATGNYVKVVQRVPVKITFDEKPDVQLGPGMSVVPTVTVR
jgi:membrane fusion protein (multidrug efflux system)